MEVKILEIRDVATFMSVLCVDMNPGLPDEIVVHATDPTARIRERLARFAARLYHLRRCGFPCEGRPNIAITPLDASGGPFLNDPYGWKGYGSRTIPNAHNYIIENWLTLKDGDVVDVEFILGETKEPKVSERFDADPR